ncbi:baseplate J-like protein [Anseongella ginsenosidimutans]|uniref:Baseplate J-like protein n=1 Tax=Anseongella ginsenosidimutans TaxID=496056 RepID=A0A4R3KNV0_9SPHI|nr:baseplate J/gp47 family protein [Anseongella ginsenosidimutans]QEC53859.1 hypothetical protein FRZ59_17005 [Anseongella ginsenosidimutans]TCS86238.1 baseplate J-like protein [Anseongella ginsenosidimutans]
MSSPCNNTNPLKRPGVNQGERVLAALLPGFVSVDEREYPDLILFAKQYAAFLHYYNKHNAAEGDWRPFMLMDVSVTLATLTRLDIQEYITYAKDIYSEIRSSATAQETELKNYFKTIFDLCFSITLLLDHYYQALPADVEFKEVLGNTVRSGLPEYFDRLKKYYAEAVNQGLIDPAGTFLFNDRPRDLLLSQDFHATDLSGIWNDPAGPPFTPVFTGASTGLKIKNIATHNLFTGITDQYLKVLARIVNAAPAHLDRTMDEFPGHSPHYALFLTFIKLFRISQERLNTFTARHLDLYYREILRLTKKDPEPDQVHLLFELAKTASAGVLLEQGTVFKAGKDRDGQELFYSLKEQAILGKGKVAALKNTFATREEGTSGSRISAGFVANSGDGMGGPLLHADKSWNAFGEPGRAFARAGFGIASDYLFLAEGKRVITFTFQVTGGEFFRLNPARLNSLFRVQLSAEKGWFEPLSAAGKTTVAADGQSFSMQVTLDGGDPPVTSWSPEVHGYQFEQEIPMALFTLREGRADDELWRLRISGIHLKVTVEGVKSLLIENDEGSLNPAKPFELFGPAPHQGSSFIMGCRELFMKARRPAGKVHASLALTWDNHETLTETFDVNPPVEIHYLEDARWKEEVFSPSQSLFALSGSSPEKKTTLQFQLPELDVQGDYSAANNYSPLSKWGFLKIILKGSFGHADYPRRLAESIAVVSATNSDGITTTSVDMGDIKEPYTPRVKEISLNYEAGTGLDLNRPDKGNFIHLTPFGYTGLPGEAFPGHLLPQFPAEGEMFIGLDELQTGQTLPLLFQVAEGTADPAASQQDVVWHYLAAGNEWKPFQKEEIADETGGLLKSGIIRFSIPPAASSKSTLMDEQLHWIRASVAKNTQSIPRLITVAAQAATAEFQDYKGEGNSFKQVLPAGAISKLLLSNPAIKKVEQPYASFGGRAREDDASWYRWVSERLRHKQRAVSIWDYERLVLEKFPGIYKVKCINHAQSNNELSPGHVLLVPVPDLHGRNAFDPLRPSAGLGLLEDIKKFLSGIASPHVELEVCNPLFEEIQLEFNVQYRSDDMAFFTRQLRMELEQFLAPWAFDTESDIEFGSRLSKSALINFIEERPYVDHISCVKMYCINGGLRSNDLEEALASSARSVFVSVKAEDKVYPHIINENVCAC